MIGAFDRRDRSPHPTDGSESRIRQADPMDACLRMCRGGCARKGESCAVTLSLSGDATPAEPAEAIAAWKREEQRTAAELARRLAAFNPAGARLLGDWVPVFDYTARCAEYWRQAVPARPHMAGGGFGFAAIPEPYGRTLAEAAQAQTEAFASHLERLADGARVSGRAEDAEALAQAAAAARRCPRAPRTRPRLALPPRFDQILSVGTRSLPAPARQYRCDPPATVHR